MSAIERGAVERTATPATALCNSSMATERDRDDPYDGVLVAVLPAADSVEPADRADHERQQPRRLTVAPRRCRSWAREVLRAEQQPQPEWQQHERDDDLKAPCPENTSTRRTAPAITPGSVPATSSPVSGPLSRCSRQNRSSPPGVAATLNSRLVGVTDGLGTRSTLSWIGNSSTAPDTPAGVVAIARRNARAAPIGYCQCTRGSVVPPSGAGRLKQAAQQLLTSQGWQRWVRVRARGGLARLCPLI